MWCTNKITLNVTHLHSNTIVTKSDGNEDFKYLYGLQYNL